MQGHERVNRCASSQGHERVNRRASSQGHERVNRCATASSQEPPDNDEECVRVVSCVHRVDVVQFNQDIPCDLQKRNRERNSALEIIRKAEV